MSTDPRPDPTTPTTLRCRYCRTTGQVEVQEKDSACGGYTDERYHCRACGKTWWVDGADA